MYNYILASNVRDLYKLYRHLIILIIKKKIDNKFKKHTSF